MDIPVQKKVPYSQNTVIQCASKKQASFQLTCSQNCTMLVQMINRCGGDIIIMMLRYNQLGHNTISIFLDGYIHNKNMKRGKTPKNGKPLNNKSCRATQRLYLVVVVSTEGVAATVYVINVKPVVKAVTANAAAFRSQNYGNSIKTLSLLAWIYIKMCLISIFIGRHYRQFSQRQNVGICESVPNVSKPCKLITDFTDI